METPSKSLSGILSNAMPSPGITKNLHLTHTTGLSLFDWLYVLSMIDLIIVLFNSAIANLGNNILKTWNSMKFPSLHVSILYAICALFWLVPNSSLVYMTDFTLWNVQDFILTESELLLLSSQFGTVTTSSLCVSCMHLGYWGVSHIQAHPLELWHTALKWHCFPHAVHVFLNAGNCLCLCAALQYLQLSILSFLFCSLYCCSFYLSVLLLLCMWLKSLTFFILSNGYLCALCIPTHCAHIHTCSLFHSCSLSGKLFFNFLHNFFIIYYINKFDLWVIYHAVCNCTLLLHQRVYLFTLCSFILFSL